MGHFTTPPPCSDDRDQAEKEKSFIEPGYIFHHFPRSKAMAI
jgi:hypothetical protein